MTDFIRYCNTLSSLDAMAAEDLEKSIFVRSYTKGDLILKQGDTCRYLYFINDGLVKVCSYKNDKEFIMRFFSENALFSVFDSFVTQTASKYIIEVLEDAKITFVGRDALDDLCQRHHCIERLFRIVATDTLVRMTKRINEMLEEEASERYTRFLIENRPIIQRLSLGDMAKYLGITPQSLSRIRNVI